MPYSGVPIIALPGLSPSFQALCAHLEKEPSFVIQQCPSASEATRLIDSELGTAIVLCSVNSQADVTPYITLLKVLKNPIQNGLVRVFVSSTLKHASVEQMFQQYKCADYLLEPVNVRSLEFKIKTALQLCQNAMSKKEEAPIEETRFHEESGRDWVEEVSPLPLQSDFWEASQVKVKRNEEGLWLISLSGPGAEAGEWKKRKVWREELWVFELNEESKKNLLVEEGVWAFRGEQPQFISQHWQFVGKDPELSFFQGDECLAMKFKTSAGDRIQIAVDANAPTASEMSEEARKVLQDLDRKVREKVKQQMLNQVFQVEAAGPVSLDSIKGDNPRIPSLSLLAMAFLTSELVDFHQGKAKEVLSRVSQYLSTVCGGIGASFVFHDASGWKILASTVSGKNALDSITLNIDPTATPSSGMIGPQQFFTPIMAINENRMIAGILMEGERAKDLSAEYLAAIAEFCQQVVSSQASSFGFR